MHEDHSFLAENLHLAHRLLPNRNHKDFPPEPFPFSGMFKHWREFRAHLLRAREEPFDVHRFYLKEMNKTAKDFGKFNLYGPALFAWCRHSRRVFHLDKDLQTLLSMTDLGEITWKDVTWPFPSFAVTFEEPLQIGNDAYQTLLASQSPEGVEPLDQRMNFWVIDAKTTEYKCLTEADRQRITKSTHAGKQLSEADIIRVIDSKRKIHSFSAQTIATQSDRIMDTFQQSHQDGRPELGAAARIVVGLCLYLSTLPPGSKHQSEWSALAKSARLDPRAVTNTSQVCNISSAHTLSREERTVFGDIQSGRQTTEMMAHFRRGYWRRPPGQGNNPEAPRIVHVRPTLVRSDRLPEGSLVGGAQSNVK